MRLQEGLVVLPGQNGGGHQYGALFAVHHALERRPDGHLGLAEAHIAAEQPVHGLGTLHIVLDLIDAAELIIGLLIGEPGLELPLPVVVRVKGIALGLHALGIEPDQLISHIRHSLLDPGLGLAPLGGVELVEPDAAVLSAADVLGHQIQLGDRHKEHIGAGIADLDIILDHPVDLPLDDPLEHADTMGDMHHVVPGGEVCQRADGVGFLLCLAALFKGSAHPSVGEYRQSDLRVLKTRGQTARQHIDLFRGQGREIGGIVGIVALAHQIAGQGPPGLLGAR